MNDYVSGDLIEAANDARKNAYAPYSNLKVGAAILMNNGQIFKGANIENVSYGLSICAERTAIFKAVSEGYREKDFNSIAIIADTVKPITPCGACRQIIAEFFNLKAPVYLANIDGSVIETTVEGLLPYAFTKENMK